MEKLRLEHMGFIFQKANFLKNLSIADNIVFPAFQLGKQSRDEIRKTAEEMMERLGIAHVGGHDIRQVSGGQIQRAAIKLCHFKPFFHLLLPIRLFAFCIFSKR